MFARHGLHAAQVLLLDEITVDLDVLGRADLLAFLRQECEERGATIIYVRRPAWACAGLGAHGPLHGRRAPGAARPGPARAQATHIFDGLESWPTHVAFLAGGRLERLAAAADIPELAGGRLLALVERCAAPPAGASPACSAARRRRRGISEVSCGWHALAPSWVLPRGLPGRVLRRAA